MFRCMSWVCVAVVLLGVAVTTPSDGNAQDDKARGKQKVEPSPADADFHDKSALKLHIVDESVKLTTKYGKLTIPVGDIDRIEFGLRIPKATALVIDKALHDLGDGEFEVREKATQTLLELKEKAYPAIKKALKNDDIEVSRRAREVFDKLNAMLTKDQKNLPSFDSVFTADSKLAGQIDGASFRASTAQFGEVTLKLSDVRRLTFRTRKPRIDLSNVQNGPDNMRELGTTPGKVFYFRVTGVQLGLFQGSVWGTGIYTLDSSLPTAAVHTGALKPGETGIVKVTTHPPHMNFVGSTQNGITSSPYPNYPGAYEVERVEEGN